MADADSAKKKQKYPYGAIFWGTLGVVAAARALYHPWRVLVKDGFASRCAGDGDCNPSMTITSYQGLTELYTPVRAQVAIAKTGTILLIPKDEAVVLEYRGADATSFLQQVKSGDEVGAGQQIGLTSSFKFGVWKLERNSAGQAVIGAPIEPASWLATHGAKISAKTHQTKETWCAQGRKLVVPQKLASSCGTVLPPPSGYALLPVSVTMA